MNSLRACAASMLNLGIGLEKDRRCEEWEALLPPRMFQPVVLQSSMWATAASTFSMISTGFGRSALTTFPILPRIRRFILRPFRVTRAARAAGAGHIRLRKRLAGAP